MRPAGWSALLLLLSGLPGCSIQDAFACESDTQCRDGDREGSCEAAGYCSVSDEGCDSGRRYGEHAGALSGECVPAGSTEGASTTEVASGGLTSTTEGGTTSLDTGSMEGTSTATTSGTTTDGTTGPLPADPLHEPCDDQCPHRCAVHEGGVYALCSEPCDAQGDECLVYEEDGLAYDRLCGRWSTCVIPCRFDADCPTDGICVATLEPDLRVCMYQY